MSGFSVPLSVSLTLVAACNSDRDVRFTVDAVRTSAPQRLHTASNAVRDVDLADRSAHAAQLVLHDARNGGDHVVAAKNNYAVAENTLNNTLVAGWTQYPAISPQVYTIEEPLQLAMLDLQAELRRRLGPNNL